MLSEHPPSNSCFGGLRAVGNSSRVHPPRFVEVTYVPKISNLKVKRKVKHVVLVGKGITFDSGGLSLKPAESMVGMKYDMTGAATVFHAVLAIAKLGLSARGYHRVLKVVRTIADCKRIASAHVAEAIGYRRGLDS